ncbi:hypothetical protein V6N13_101619 [Hibiscus sabdariffa]
MFYISAVYACNGRNERVALWNDLLRLRGRVGGCSWLLAGDFNIINCPQESSDFDGSQSITGAMREFRYCQEGLDVVDHPFSGHLFTWCNFHEDDPLSWKLGRVIGNQAWFVKFPGAYVEFLDPFCSDHCPSHVVLRAPLARPPKPFKFFGFWADHPGFLDVVAAS